MDGPEYIDVTFYILVSRVALALFIVCILLLGYCIYLLSVRLYAIMTAEASCNPESRIDPRLKLLQDLESLDVRDKEFTTWAMAFFRKYLDESGIGKSARSKTNLELSESLGSRIVMRDFARLCDHVQFSGSVDGSLESNVKIKTSLIELTGRL